MQNIQRINQKLKDKDLIDKYRIWVLMVIILIVDQIV